MNHNTESQFIKRNCVNFQDGVCRALNGLYCASVPCKFFKTQQMVHEQIARIRERLPDYMLEKSETYEL